MKSTLLVATCIVAAAFLTDCGCGEGGRGTASTGGDSGFGLDTGQPGAGGPTIKFFDASPSWGDAPLDARLFWEIDAPSDSKLTCYIDVEGDGPVTIQNCPLKGNQHNTYAVHGAYHTRLIVEDEAKRTATKQLDIYANSTFGGTGQNAIKFDDKVVFVETQPGYQSVVLENDQVTLEFDLTSHVPDYQAGTILWGIDGHGYLRKVKSASKDGTKVIVGTEHAKLDEAIKEGTIGFKKQHLAIQKLECLGDCKVTPKDPYTPQTPVIMPGPVNLGCYQISPILAPPAPTEQCYASYEMDLDDIDVIPGVSVSNGTFIIEFDATFLVDIQMQWIPPAPVLKEFLFELTPSASFSADIEAGLSFELEPPKEYRYSQVIGTVFLPVVVPVPVTINFEPTVMFEASAGMGFGFSPSVTAAITGGLHYHDGITDAYVTPELTENITKDPAVEASGQVGATLTIAPGFSTKVFDVVGPYVSPELAIGGEIKADFTNKPPSICAQADISLDVAFGVEFDLFTIHLSVEQDAPIADFTFYKPPCWTPPCVPTGCGGKECGDDGCGNSCGQCNKPPQIVCSDNSTLRSYDAAGTCGQDGKCSYAHTDTSCPNGCANAKCRVCVPGTQQCKSNGAGIEECDTDGSGWHKATDCPCGCSNALCKTSCTVGEKRCNNGGTCVEKCTGGCNWQVVQQCQYGCENAACKSSQQNCVPGQKKCNGNSVQVCKPDGSDWGASTPCGCGGCSNGVCNNGQQCTPGALRCNGNAIEQCATDGCGWAAPNPPQVCDCGCSNGSCISTACALGDDRCNPGTDELETCSNDECSWRTVSSCQCGCAGSSCKNSAGCTPGAAQCNTNANAVETCDPDGCSWSTTENCVKGCSAGQCQGCIAGQKKCLNSKTVGICKSDGTDWIPLTNCACACSGGNCVTSLCTPSSTSCSSGKVQTCNTDGCGWTVSQDCTVAPYCGCSGGTCVGQTCTPGDKQCNGSYTAVQTCNANGCAWSVTQSCSCGCSGGVCVGQVCTAGMKQCSGSSLQTCKSDGCGWNSQTCTCGCSGTACITGSCTPGNTQSCNCAGGGTGTQTCDSSCNWGTTCNGCPTCSNCTGEVLLNTTGVKQTTGCASSSNSGASGGAAVVNEGGGTYRWEITGSQVVQICVDLSGQTCSSANAQAEIRGASSGARVRWGDSTGYYADGPAGTSYYTFSLGGGVALPGQTSCFGVNATSGTVYVHYVQATVKP